MEQSPFLDSSSILSRKNRDGSRSAPRGSSHLSPPCFDTPCEGEPPPLYTGLFPVKRAPSIVLFRPGTGEGERGRKFHEESGAKFAFARLCWVEYPACSLNSIDSVFGVRARQVFQGTGKQNLQNYLARNSPPPDFIIVIILLIYIFPACSWCFFILVSLVSSENGNRSSAISKYFFVHIFVISNFESRLILRRVLLILEAREM